MKENIRTKYFNLGYYVFGPLLTFINKWIIENLHSDDGVEKIAFLSRDGYIVKRCYDRMYSCNEINIPALYLLGSRHLFYHAVINEEMDELYDRLFNIPENQTVKSLLTRLELINDNRIYRFLKSICINFDDKIRYIDKNKFNDLKILLHPLLKANAKNKRKRIIRYWDYCDLKNRKVVIWNLGWNATQEQAIDKLIKLTNYPINVKFYMFYVIDKENLQIANKISSCITNKNMFVYSFIPMFDAFFSAPTPMVLDITDDMRFTPVYDHVDNINWKYINIIQKGAMKNFNQNDFTLEQVIQPIKKIVNKKCWYCKLEFQRLNSSVAYGSEQYNIPLSKSVETLLRDG